MDNILDSAMANLDGLVSQREQLKGVKLRVSKFNSGKLRASCVYCTFYRTHEH